MHTEAQCWLPESALQGSGLDAQLGEAVRGWSQRWFGKVPWRIQSGLAILAPPPAERVLRLGDDLALYIPGGVPDVMAAAMLNRSIIANELTEADRRLIDGLVQAGLQDLAHTIAALFGLPSDRAWAEARAEDVSLVRPRGCIIAGEQRRAPLHLLVAHDVVVAHATRRARPGRPAPKLVSLDAALGEQRVDIAARIGACSLAYGDIVGLAVGDVLILDRPLDAALEIALDGHVLSAGSCAAAQGESGYQLEIIEPLGKA